MKGGEYGNTEETIIQSLISLSRQVRTKALHGDLLYIYILAV